MARFKDFGKGKTDIEQLEPLSFKLYDEEFLCLPAVQAQFLIDLVSSVDGDEDGGDSLRYITTFFGSVLLDESNERFQALLRDKNRIVTMESLTEIVSWLMSEYTGRPNQQPEDLPAGQ